MEKKYNLCIEVLRRLQKEGILSEIMIVGSWCIYFYKNYFSDVSYSSYIRTRDIDFLVPIPFKIKEKVDIPELLKDLGFVLDFHIKGYIRLCHPDLIIDFLVPERGRGLDKPYPLPQLGIKAQALRFLDFLVENSMKFKINDLTLNLPHPAAFAIHKLIISSRRPREEKKVKEREEAVRVIKSLIAKREEETVNRLFNSMPRKWRTKVIRSLEESKAKEILAFLA
jgi:hypothetical protein